MTSDKSLGFVPPEHSHTFQNGNAAKKVIMVAITILKIDNTIIRPPPNSFDKERPVTDVLFFNLLQFINLRKVDFGRHPFTVWDR